MGKIFETDTDSKVRKNRIAFKKNAVIRWQDPHANIEKDTTQKRGDILVSNLKFLKKQMEWLECHMECFSKYEMRW